MPRQELAYLIFSEFLSDLLLTVRRINHESALKTLWCTGTLLEPGFLDRFTGFVRHTSRAYISDDGTSLGSDDTMTMVWMEGYGLNLTTALGRSR